MNLLIIYKKLVISIKILKFIPIINPSAIGLDIRDAPSFFATTGWNESCSFADDYDQGRNVGQKGMIFIHGVRAMNF